MATRNVVIVMGRCSRSKQSFGIRFQRREPSQWAGTWAFAIKDQAAKKEGYEKTRVEGEFLFDPTFPGCPHCSSHAFFVCECGKLACMQSESRRVTCPWCNRTADVTGTATRMDGGGDR